MLAAVQPDHTDAYFALVGALGAAILAIVGNQYGMWRQRKAETDRLDRQLQAEQERLTIQLAHEREVRNLDEARRVLGPTIQVLTESVVPTTICAQAVRNMAEHSSEANRQALKTRRLELLEASIQVNRQLYPTGMLLSAKSSVYEAIAAVHDAMQELLALTRDTDSPDLAMADKADAIDGRHTKALATFNDAVYDAVGWRPAAASSS